jgi:hypothetical protein
MRLYGGGWNGRKERLNEVTLGCMVCGVDDLGCSLSGIDLCRYSQGPWNATSWALECSPVNRALE